jgi:glycosyltransferase involved in cell wall biosynthesis
VTAPRRIGILYGHPLDVGGVESHLLSLVSRADPYRWRWRILAPTSPSFSKRALEAGAVVEHWAPRHALDVTALRALIRSMRAAPLDLLHVHDPRALPIAQAAAAYLGIPVVYTVHLPVGGEPVHRSRGRLYGLVERVLLRAAPPARVVHVSARALAESPRGSNGQLVLVPNGVDLGLTPDPGVRERIRAALGVPDEACVVTSVARLVPQKGLDLLLDAWAHGLADTDAWLWLVGEGAARASLQGQVARLGLGGRVVLLGQRQDISDVLAATDVFVLASRQETTPIALLEAMAAGRPCVATDVGDCRSMLDDGAAGRVVAPGDVVGLAAAVREIVADRALGARLGRAAHARAEFFSDVAMAELTAGVYAGVLSSELAIGEAGT